MQVRIITECFFDTMLIEKIIQNNKLILHRKGCNNVVESLKNEKIKDWFKIGVIDKDKNPLHYLKKFEVYETDGFNFYWRNDDKFSIIIQLMPPLEQWILDICKLEKLDIEKIGLSNDLNVLRDYTKRRVVKETQQLKRLVIMLNNSDSQRVNRLKKWMKHLIGNKNNFDINYIKNA